MSEHPEHQSKQEREWNVYVTEDGAIALGPGSHNDRKPIIVIEVSASKQERMREALEEILNMSTGDSISGLIHVKSIARAALSDVTEQKDLGDCPEPLGQTTRATNINPL